MGFSFSASPAGALASACTGTPSSFALLLQNRRAAAEAGTQMAPVPMILAIHRISFFSQ